MFLELFAQAGGKAEVDARQAGMVVGVVLAVIICFAIPISVGVMKKHPIVGLIGSFCTIPAAILLGCLGGLPVAAVFVVIILVMGDGGTSTKRKKKRRRPVEDYDDNEEDDDDRPSRRRRDDDDDDYDRPRKRRDYD